MHLIPVVLTTRWPWIVIACAPPCHIALTTAWMSCWCTSRSLGSTDELEVTSAEASESVTVTPGPTCGSRPAGPRIAAALRLTARTCLLPTEPLSREICWFRSDTFALSPSTPRGVVAHHRGEVGEPSGAQVGPLAAVGADTNSAPLSTPTSGVATRQTRDRRGRGGAGSSGPSPGARVRGPGSLRWGRAAMPTKVTRVVREDAIPASVA